MSGLSHILGTLEDKSLLDLLPDLKKVILEKGTIRLFGTGEKLCTQGVPLTHLLIPISENIRLQTDSADSDGVPTFNGYLQKHRSLCLGEILRGEVAPYSAYAEVPTSVLSIPTIIILAFLEKRPEVLNYLRLMTTSEPARRLKRLLEEKKVANEVLFSLYDCFQPPFEIASGSEVNLSKPGFYLIESGNLLIRTTAGAFAQFSVSLRDGTWFGGESLVAPHQFSYSAQATEPTKVRLASLVDLQPLLQDPKVLESLYEERWVQINQRTVEETETQVTPLPGKRLGRSEIRELKMALDPTQLTYSEGDAGSTMATIENLAALMRLEINASSIQAQFRFGGKTTFLTIASAIERFGLLATPLLTRFKELDRHLLPGIINYGPRIVLLIKKEPKSVVLMDPGVGLIRVGRNEFEEHWRGNFLEVTKVETDFVPNEEELASQSKSLGVKKEVRVEAGQALLRAIFQALRAVSPVPYLVVLATLIGIGLNWLIPKFAQELIDSVLGLKNIHAVWVLTIGTLLVSTFQLGISIFNSFISREASFRFGKSLQTLFYRHALSSSRTMESDRRIGDVQMRMGAMQSVIGFVSGQLISVGHDVLLMLVYGLSLLSYRGSLALIGLSILPVVLIIRVLFLKSIRRLTDRSFELTRTTSSQIAEQISAMPTIKASAREDAQRAQWEKTNIDATELHRSLGTKSSQVESLISLLTTGAQIGGLWLGFTLVQKGEVTLGQVFAVNMYFSAMIEPARRLADFFATIELVRISFRRVLEVFSAKRDEGPRESVVTQFVPLQGKIRLERVSFRYREDEDWVLKDVSVTIFPNQTVALVGRSGCGKTTLARLISGDLTPTTGRILFDEFDSSLLSRSCLQTQIGFIMQSSDLFAGTVGENIAYADDAPSEMAIKLAAAKGGAADFADMLPGNYQFYLSEGGMGLSGGQRQRVSISRTLYRDPRILILDEATSALDSESEQAILMKMEEVVPGRTTIIIAHRVSTIRNTDRIIVLNEGKLIGDGTHPELLDNSNVYRELFKNAELGSGNE